MKKTLDVVICKSGGPDIPPTHAQPCQKTLASSSNIACMSDILGNRSSQLPTKSFCISLPPILLYEWQRIQKDHPPGAVLCSRPGREITRSLPAKP